MLRSRRKRAGRGGRSISRSGPVLVGLRTRACSGSVAGPMRATSTGQRTWTSVCGSGALGGAWSKCAMHNANTLRGAGTAGSGRVEAPNMRRPSCVTCGGTVRMLVARGDERVRCCHRDLRQSGRDREMPVIGFVDLWARPDRGSEHGRDGSGDLAASLGATVLRNARNPGFGAGQNRGIACTGAPYVLLLNPDAEAEAAGVETGLRLLRDESGIGAVQGQCQRGPRSPGAEPGGGARTSSLDRTGFRRRTCLAPPAFVPWRAGSLRCETTSTGHRIGLRTWIPWLPLRYWCAAPP